MYCYKSRVRYSEVDSEQQLTFLGLLNYLQDCCTFQSEDLGIGIDYLKENQVAWVLSSWQVEVNRRPRLGEMITVNTWPYEFGGFFGYRNFTVQDEQGEICAYANSVWVFMDMKAGRPSRLLPEVNTAYQVEPKYPMEYAKRKLTLPQEMEKQAGFVVQPEQIDTNHHVNNERYVAMAQRFVPIDSRICSMQAEYKSAAVLGDSIFPFVSKNDRIITVSLADDKGKPYAIVKFEIEA